MTEPWLPTELWLTIFNWLEPKDIFHTIQVCTLWRDIGQHIPYIKILHTQYQHICPQGQLVPIVFADVDLDPWAKLLPEDDKWNPLVSRFLLCVQFDHEELGRLLYQQLQAAPDSVHTRVCVRGGSVLLGTTTIHTAEWLHKLPGWKWWHSSAKEVSQLLATGKYQFTDWLIRHKALKPSIDPISTFTLRDNHFARRALYGVCDQSNLEDLQYITQQLRELDCIPHYMAHDVCCIATLVGSSDPCALYCVQEGVLQDMPNGRIPIFALFAALLSNHLETAAFLVEKYHITGEELAAEMNDMSTAMEQMFCPFVRGGFAWAQAHMGLDWDMLNLSLFVIVSRILQSETLRVSTLRALEEIAPPHSLDGLWSFLLINTQLFSSLQQSCDIQHFTLIEKAALLSTTALSHTAQTSSFACVRQDAERILHSSSQTLPTLSPFVYFHRGLDLQNVLLNNEATMFYSLFISWERSEKQKMSCKSYCPLHRSNDV